MPTPARDRAPQLRRQFGARVRSLRLEARLSQEELAFRAGLHPTYVSSIERGQRNVSLVNIHAIAEGLAVPPGDLFGR